MMDIAAKCLGISLTRMQKETQQTVVKAELVPSPRIARKHLKPVHSNSSICVIQ